MLFPATGHAVASSDAGVIAREMVQISYIEAERRKESVPDDFAASVLQWSRERIAKTTPQARAEASRIAAQIRNAPRRTNWLEGFPEPWRVRADMVAASKGQSRLVIDARQAGRFLMFSLAMQRLGDTVFNDRLPKDVQRLQIAYLVHYWDLRDRNSPTFEDACPERAPCRRRTFYETSGDYRYDIEHARDAAERYLPPNLHAQFIEVTAPMGTRTPPPAPPLPEQQTLWTEIWPAVTGVLFAGIGLFLLIAFLRFLAQKRGERQTSTAYGSAKFAAPETGLPPPDRLFHGTFFGFSYQLERKDDAIASPVLSAPENHTLIVAPSRTGKGTRVIVPTLLLYTPSLITLDPKGENAAQTARYRRDQLGHKVHIVNPWGSHANVLKSYGFAPATINPLDVLDRNDPGVAATATAIARAICIRPNDTNTIWQNQASAMLTALLLWVTDQPEETKTLGRIAELVSGGSMSEDLRKGILPKMIASSSFEGAMRKSVGQFVHLADETYSGILFNLTEALQFLIDPLLVRTTNHSTFDLADLTQPDTTVYLVIPAEQLETQATWVRLLFASVVRTFRRHKPASQGRRSMFLLDEFPALGRMDSFVSDIAVVGGSGLDITIAIQNLGQLDAHYGQSAGTIISNCGWKWFCNVQDLTTAEYVSKMLGTKTQATESETVGQNSASTAYGETPRPLRTPDEVQSIGKDYAFVFRPGARPHLVETCDHWQMKARLGGLAKGGQAYPLPDFDAVDENPERSPPVSAAVKFWQKTADNPPPPEQFATDPSTNPRRRDALATLGLEDPVTFDEIRAAYEQLILERLPDNEEGDEILAKREKAFSYLQMPKSGDFDL